MGFFVLFFLPSRIPILEALCKIGKANFGAENKNVVEGRYVQN